MKKNGFTLVELLAIIILLSLLMLLVFPKVLETTEKKQAEIDNSKKTLIENAAFEYMNNDINNYPQDIGKIYCFKLDTLDKENLIPVDISDVKKEYTYITVKIGVNNSNSYNLVKTVSDVNSCK